MNTIRTYTVTFKGSAGKFIATSEIKIAGPAENFDHFAHAVREADKVLTTCQTMTEEWVRIISIVETASRKAIG